MAILMQAGFSLGAAVRAQLLTAISAMIGTILAVATGEQQAGLLLNFTAGGFIYVATVDVLPSLLQQPSSVSGRGSNAGAQPTLALRTAPLILIAWCACDEQALQTAAELGAFFAGVGMMLLVMVFEAGH